MENFCNEIPSSDPHRLSSLSLFFYFLVWVKIWLHVQNEASFPSALSKFINITDSKPLGSQEFQRINFTFLEKESNDQEVRREMEKLKRPACSVQDVHRLLSSSRSTVCLPVLPQAPLRKGGKAQLPQLHDPACDWVFGQTGNRHQGLKGSAHRLTGILPCSMDTSQAVLNVGLDQSDLYNGFSLSDLSLQQPPLVSRCPAQALEPNCLALIPSSTPSYLAGWLRASFPI